MCLSSQSRTMRIGFGHSTPPATHLDRFATPTSFVLVDRQTLRRRRLGGRLIFANSRGERPLTLTHGAAASCQVEQRHRRTAISLLAGTLNSAAQASKGRLGASSSVAPTTISIGAPVADPSVGSIGPIKWMKYISATTNNPAGSTAWRARPTIKIMTDVSNTFLVVNGRSLIGAGATRAGPTSANNRKRDRQSETALSHIILAEHQQKQPIQQ
jgi:hypothetical protein